jgi:tRNA A58 N-methylase Trm61
MAKEQEGLGKVVIPSMKKTLVKRSTTRTTTIIIFHDSKVIAIILDIRENMFILSK